MTHICTAVLVAAATALTLRTPAVGSPPPWKIGTPIATYWAGPAITDVAAKQMRAGGFNVIWCQESELDTAKKYGLRAMLQNALLVPATLDDTAKVAELDALIDRVKKHTAMYAYFIADEPSAAAFEGLGRLVAHLRSKDPAHLAYINLFPTYANNEQLGVPGDAVAAYTEYLRRFIQTVKPDLISYDHYHFTVNGDREGYFLNLALIRQAALDVGKPFLNIVQACTWDTGMRVPNADEMRWLNSTSLAYGAQGLSYFVYFYKGFYDQFKEKAGQMMRPGGTTTLQNESAKSLNRQFVAVAGILQDLTSLGAFHVGYVPLGARALPRDAAFQLDLAAPGTSSMPADGILFGLFGRGDRPTHAFVVNLDYRHDLVETVVGPGRLEVYDATSRKWRSGTGNRATIHLPPGGGALVRSRP